MEPARPGHASKWEIGDNTVAEPAANQQVDDVEVTNVNEPPTTHHQHDSGVQVKVPTHTAVTSAIHRGYSPLCGALLSKLTGPQRTSREPKRTSSSGCHHTRLSRANHARTRGHGDTRNHTQACSKGSKRALGTGLLRRSGSPALLMQI